MVDVLVWSVFEVGLWWGYANNALPFSALAANPVWFVLWMLLMPFWRNLHFYWVHRLIHWPPLYRAVPQDKWFGSFHDGTPEADAKFRSGRMR